MTSPGATALHPSTVLPAYADTLFRARRVAILGDALLGLGELFAERGARSVHVFDPDPARAAEATAKGASRGSALSVRPQYSVLSDDLGIRAGAFDVAVVPDLSALRSLPGILREVKRLLTPSGVAFLCAPNPDAERWLLPPSPAASDALGYYDVYDLVAASFTEVRMLGQAPFVGYALVDFGADDPEVSIDTSALAEPEVPEWYVAVASDRPLELGDFTLVEIPLSEVARMAAPTEPRTIPIRAGSEARDLALAEAETRIAMLVAENERLASAAKQTAIDAATRDRSHTALSMRLGELENEAADARARFSEMEQLAGEAHARAERLGHQVRDLDEELVRERERAGRLAKKLDDDEKALAPALARVEELQKALTDAVDPPTLRPLEKAEAERVERSKRGRAILNRGRANSQRRSTVVIARSRRCDVRSRLAPTRPCRKRRMPARSRISKRRCASAHTLRRNFGTISVKRNASVVSSSTRTMRCVARAPASLAMTVDVAAAACPAPTPNDARVRRPTRRQPRGASRSSNARSRRGSRARPSRASTPTSSAH